MNAIRHLRGGVQSNESGAEMVLEGTSRAEYLTYRGQARSAMFFNRNGSAIEFIKAGSVFTRVRSDRTVETAKVIAVASDSFGIPHVRYELFFEKPNAVAGFSEGSRVLALKTFADMYRDRLAH